MSNSNNTVITDISEVLDMFKNLSYKEQKKTYREALRKSAAIIQRAARKNLKKIIGKAATHIGKGAMTKGIKTRVRKNGKSAKVHIMGDFRLKFFEMGTRERFIKKNKAYRGKMTATHFFKSANEAKKGEAEDKLIQHLENAIKKINEKHKNR